VRNVAAALRWSVPLLAVLALRAGSAWTEDPPAAAAGVVEHAPIVLRAQDVTEAGASSARRLGLAHGRRLKSNLGEIGLQEPAHLERGRALPAELKEEIAAIAEGAGMATDALLGLNGLLGHYVSLSPPHAEWPREGTPVGSVCGVVAHGEATSMGQLLHAATLATHTYPALGKMLRVFVEVPADGHPLAYVGFVGFTGALAGFNAHGLSVSYESFQGPESQEKGALPAPFLVRRLLQRATSLAEAERILREQPLTTGARLTIADGRRLDARVVERYGEHVNVRRPVEGLSFGEDPGAGVECFVGRCDPEVPRGDGQGDAAFRQSLEAALGRVRVPVLEGALSQSGVLGLGTLFSCVIEPQMLRMRVGLRIGAMDEALSWTSVDLLTLLGPELGGRYALPWRVTDTGTFTVAPESTKIGDVTLTRVSFDSAAPSGHAQNDRVNGVWYRPENPKGALIALPAWKESNLAGQGLLAIRLAQAGYAVLVMPLPWQADRTPPGVGSGSWTLSADLARTRAAMLQGAADAARASLWLERAQGFAPARQGVMGVSLGGHAAALAYGAYPERFAAGVFLLAGGRLETALLRPNRVTGRMRKILLERGVTAEEALDLIRAIDGATWADPKRKAGVLIVGADKDDVIPPENVRALAAAYGGARTEWLSGDHLAILLYLPRTIDWVVGHLDATLKSP
jgi:dienelactone hydrolase